MFHNPNEQRRLVQIGLKAGRDYVEGMKALHDPSAVITNEMKVYLGEVSTDFAVGAMYDTEATEVHNEIGPAYMNPNPDEAETKANLAYRKSNCSLIQ
jgi:hypothetical protein